MTTRKLHAACLIAALLAGCGAVPAEERGRELFQAPSFAGVRSNPFACAHCHATTSGDARRLPGYTMAGATQRPSWWGGEFSYLLDAVNHCRKQFMFASPITADDADGRALRVFLESLRGEAVALPLTVVQNLDVLYYNQLPAGDAVRGAPLYGGACAGCHGAAHSGDGRLADLVPRIPDETIANHGHDPLTGARPITIEKMRHGKFFLAGGRMPLYSLEALSDREMVDILAHLGL